MVEVFDDVAALNLAAAELFIEKAAQAIAACGSFHVVLSGGETPRPLYELLASKSYRNRVNWGQVHVYWSDERFVPPDDPRSNEGMARRVWLDHVPIPAAQIHPMYCQKTPGQAAQDYEELLKQLGAGQCPRFDFVLLGIGADGHTASLFPGTAAVAERTLFVCELYLPEHELYRLTLTVPVLNQARLVVFMVSGTSKAAMLRRILTDPATEPVPPARLIAPQTGEIKWLVDRAAAALLTTEQAGPE
jgi:6-phosphogluconolactonase